MKKEFINDFGQDQFSFNKTIEIQQICRVCVNRYICLVNGEHRCKKNPYWHYAKDFYVALAKHLKNFFGFEGFIEFPLIPIAKRKKSSLTELNRKVLLIKNFIEKNGVKKYYHKGIIKFDQGMMKIYSNEKIFILKDNGNLYEYEKRD